MAKLLKDFGEIKNEGRCLGVLKTQIKEFAKFSESQVADEVNKSVKKLGKIRYFDYSYLELNENESGKTVMWVDTGYTDVNKNPIYVQFTGGNPWTGALVGTEDYIRKFQETSRNNTSRENLEKELGVDLSKIEGVTVTFADDVKPVVAKVNKNETFLSALYEKLLIPNSWTIPSLDNYINLCIVRINNCIVKGVDCSDCVVFNESKTLALINSGLLDKFGKYIFLVTKIFYGEKNDGKCMELGYTGLRFAGSKSSLCEDGFSKSDLTKPLERVSFSKNGVVDLVFTGSLDDFDLDSRSRLEHCIVERRFRFPEHFIDATSEMICSDFIKAIELAVELNKYDRNYIKPIYNRNRDSIDFVIPYHVGNDFKKKPELGIVIAYLGGYWQAMTVLDYDDVIRDIKLFNMYENETF